MAAKKSKKTNKFDSNTLSFERSIQVDEALFYATTRDIFDHEQQISENIAPPRVPVQVLEKGVRGQSSEDNAKKPGVSSPQTVEFAVVPQNCDALELSFGVRVLPSSRRPVAAGSRTVADAYKDLTEHFAKAGGYRNLAELYVWNIANGRFAWRNRFQTDRAEVRIAFEGKSLIFDPLALDLDSPNSVEEMAEVLIVGDAEMLNEFIGRFADALEQTAFKFFVSWVSEADVGQEVFPSQEYLRQAKQEKDVSRVYGKLPTFWKGERIEQASMHSQKIGAAIRHIDVWHEDGEERPIAVNPYGGVQESGEVLRAKGSGQSFYDIRRNADLVENLTPEKIPNGDVHFMVANLVRGGVFVSAKEIQNEG